MNAILPTTQKRAPMFGVMSLALPLVGLAIGYLAASSMTGEAGLAAGFVWLVIFCGLAFAGFIFAVVGIRKRERFPVLSWIGLILDPIPVLYLLIFVLDYG